MTTMFGCFAAFIPTHSFGRDHICWPLCQCTHRVLDPLCVLFEVANQGCDVSLCFLHTSTRDVWIPGVQQCFSQYSQLSIGKRCVKEAAFLNDPSWRSNITSQTEKHPSDVFCTCFTTWEALWVIRYSAASMALRMLVTLTCRQKSIDLVQPLTLFHIMCPINEYSIFSLAGHWTSSAAAWYSGSGNSVSIIKQKRGTIDKAKRRDLMLLSIRPITSQLSQNGLTVTATQCDLSTASYPCFDIFLSPFGKKNRREKGENSSSF